jgi:hypothetical protein
LNVLRELVYFHGLATGNRTDVGKYSFVNRIITDWNQLTEGEIGVLNSNMWFVKKVSVLTTVHEVDKACGVLTLMVFNVVPFRSYTLRPKFLPLLETFFKLLFWDV